MSAPSSIELAMFVRYVQKNRRIIRHNRAVAKAPGWANVPPLGKNRKANKRKKR